MRKAIGFKDFPVDWEGPIALDFIRNREHTATGRYKCELDKRVFDFYIPLFLLEGRPGLPDKICVVVGKSAQALTAVGFHAAPRPAVIKSDLCEYDLSDEKVNSIRYKTSDQKYSMYVPKEIFQDGVPPKRLFVKVLTAE